MRREAAVPIDEELEAAIRDQQRRVLDQWPDGTTCLVSPGTRQRLREPPAGGRHLLADAQPLAGDL